MEPMNELMNISSDARISEQSLGVRKKETIRKAAESTLGSKLHGPKLNRRKEIRRSLRRYLWRAKQDLFRPPRPVLFQFCSGACASPPFYRLHHVSNKSVKRREDGKEEATKGEKENMLAVVSKDTNE